MTEGAIIPSLDLYIHIEWSGRKVKRIYLSHRMPDEPSELAEQIAAHLETGSACPRPDLDLSGRTDFQKKIYAKVQEIRRGETMTYGEVASSAGSPGGARAVGQVMARNPFAILVPCHRVVARAGNGGFAWGIKTKEKMLMLEKGVLSTCENERI